MYIIFILLFLYVFRDYIAFAIFAFPLRVFNPRMRLPIASCNVMKNSVEKPTKQSEQSGLFLKKIFIFFIAYERYLIHRIKMFPSHTVRNWIYRNIYLVDKHKTSVIYFGCEIRSGVNLHIGKGSIIGDNCILDARQGIYIGDNVNLSSEVHLWTEAHDVNDPYFRSMPCNHGPIHIGNRAWLGANVTVLD